MLILVLRFVLAGSIVAAAPVLAERVGPAAAGLVLAFPTLITLGLVGVGLDGGDVAGTARGVLVGLLALASYAAVVASLASRVVWPVALLAGAGAWGLVAGGFWLWGR